MGWILDSSVDPDGEHEGYFAGVVRENGRWIELDSVNGDRRCDIRYVQVACVCGWRSPRMLAPIGTEWAPFAVFFDREDQWHDIGFALWRPHIGAFDQSLFGAKLAQFASRSGE